jgi:hypothetical protein
VNLQHAGEKISISRTNVYKLRSEKQNQPAESGAIETIDVRTPMVTMHYEVGDKVTVSPDSRDIPGARRDNRSTFRIDRTKMDLENQCTNLSILRTQNLD